MLERPSGNGTATVEVQRVTALFERLPSSVVSISVGVLLVFIFLLPIAGLDLLKPWATFMLTTLAVRGWIWQMFRQGHIDASNAWRWEWSHAFGMLLTGIGWGALNGPLYPPGADARVFILVMTIIVAFSGMIYSYLSRASFLFFVLPTLIPGLARYILQQNEAILIPSLVASAGCVIVLISIHQSLYSFATKHLQRQVEAENLLAEQTAIFQATTAGIAVIRENRIVKCNRRLGEILGRSLQELQAMPPNEIFANQNDAAAFLADSSAAIAAGGSFQSLHRLRRQNGSEFWAELSGRQMTNDSKSGIVWLISEAPARNVRSTE